MRNYDIIYAFVSTVKYAKEYWVSATYKITNKFIEFIAQRVSPHEIDIQSQ